MSRLDAMLRGISGACRQSGRSARGAKLGWILSCRSHLPCGRRMAMSRRRRISRLGGLPLHSLLSDGGTCRRCANCLPRGGAGFPTGNRAAGHFARCLDSL